MSSEPPKTFSFGQTHEAMVAVEGEYILPWSLRRRRQNEPCRRIRPHGWRTGSEAYQGSPTNPCEIRLYLLAAVGLEVQSNRILTCLIADQVAITLGLEVIKELQPVVVAPCLVRLKPFVQFFLRESRSWMRSRGAASGFADGCWRGLYFSYHDKCSSLDEKG